MSLTPRPEVADPSLWRPDWLQPAGRLPDILWLDKNENRDPNQLSLVAQVVGNLDRRYLSTYLDSAALYRKLGQWLGVDPSQLILGAGSDGIIRAVFETFVSVGDKVLITAPTFAMYPVYCRIYGANTTSLSYAPSDNGPRLDCRDVLAAIERERPRLICIPNPDSPTGTSFSDRDMEAIIGAAGEAGAAILIDEAYHPFHTTVLPLMEKYPHLMIARTTAKAWGMAGLRIGYGIASAPVAKLLHKVRPMYECSTIAIAAFEAMLDHADEMVKSTARLEDGKQYFLDAMEGMGFRVLRGKGNFLHVAFGPHAERVHASLKPICYYRQDFSEPCLKGFSRFSSTVRAQFQPVIDAVQSAIGIA